MDRSWNGNGLVMDRSWNGRGSVTIRSRIGQDFGREREAKMRTPQTTTPITILFYNTYAAPSPNYQLLFTNYQHPPFRSFVIQAFEFDSSFDLRHSNFRPRLHPHPLPHYDVVLARSPARLSCTAARTTTITEPDREVAHRYSLSPCRRFSPDAWAKHRHGAIECHNREPVPARIAPRPPNPGRSQRTLLAGFSFKTAVPMSPPNK
jgi:hypothetical protein